MLCSDGAINFDVLDHTGNLYAMLARVVIASWIASKNSDRAQLFLRMMALKRGGSILFLPRLDPRHVANTASPLLFPKGTWRKPDN
jgi:hypothetical protein